MCSLAGHGGITVCVQGVYPKKYFVYLDKHGYTLEESLLHPLVHKGYVYLAEHGYALEESLPILWRTKHMCILPNMDTH